MGVAVFVVCILNLFVCEYTFAGMFLNLTITTPQTHMLVWNCCYKTAVSGSTWEMAGERFAPELCPSSNIVQPIYQ